MGEPVRYMERSRLYYEAQGFAGAYRWAHSEEAPFTRLPKPLAECRVALVTTASPDWDGDPDERPLPAVFAMSSAEPPARLYTQNRSWDKDATHTDDLDSYFPIHRLQKLAASGRCRLAPRAFGIPTEYSQRSTNEEDAPELLRLCREDGVEAAIFAPL
jgi:hypothetical protein